MLKPLHPAIIMALIGAAACAPSVQAQEAGHNRPFVHVECGSTGRVDLTFDRTRPGHWAERNINGAVDQRGVFKSRDPSTLTLSKPGVEIQFNLVEGKCVWDSAGNPTEIKLLAVRWE